MNIIEQTLARYPSFPQAVIDRLLEKAAEDMAKTLDTVLEKAAEDILAGYQKAKPEPEPTPEPKAAEPEANAESSAAKGDATSAWSRLSPEERSAQMKIRWIKRRQTAAADAYEALRASLVRSYIDPTPDQKRAWAQIKVAMGQANLHEADNAMRMAHKLINKNRIMWKSEFLAVVDAWGKLT